MICLNQKEIQSCVTREGVMEMVEKTYLTRAAGDFYMPERTVLKHNGNSILYMPCFVPECFGTKALTIFPGNREYNVPTLDGIMIINDAKTGQIAALMDGKELTAQRTGAGGGVGIKYLAKEDAKTVGVIGGGVQGLYQAYYACAVRDIETVYIFDNYAELANSFGARLSEKIGREIKTVVCATVEDMLKNSEIVCVATSSKTPVLPDDAELLRGKCFIGIGSHNPDVREFPAAIWDVVDEVYMDLPFAAEESGDLCMAIAEGSLTRDRLRLMEDLVGKLDNDARKKETTFYKGVGFAMTDVIVGNWIYEQAAAKGIGQKLEL